MKRLLLGSLLSCMVVGQMVAVGFKGRPSGSLASGFLIGGTVSAMGAIQSYCAAKLILNQFPIESPYSLEGVRMKSVGSLCKVVGLVGGSYLGQHIVKNFGGWEADSYRMGVQLGGLAVIIAGAILLGIKGDTIGN